MVSDQVEKMQEQVGNCPSCKRYDLVKGEGRLDQSGEQYLPTTTWTCGGMYGGCGYKYWERAAPGALPLPYFSPDVKPQVVGHHPMCSGMCGCHPDCKVAQRRQAR